MYFNYNVEDGTRRDPKSRFAKFVKPNPFFIHPIPHTTARRLPTPVQYVPGRNLDTAWPTNGALGGQEGVLTAETTKRYARAFICTFCPSQTA